MRKFVDEEVKPDAQLHEKDGKRPTVELIQKMGAMNLNAMVRPLPLYLTVYSLCVTIPPISCFRRTNPVSSSQRLGPTKLLHGLTLMGGVKGEEFDYFSEQIVTQELVRGGARGYADGLQGGMVIGLPPLLNFGSDKLKKELVPDILAGKKFISLAITEAFAGSDVAGLRTTATKTADGKHYIVSNPLLSFPLLKLTLAPCAGQRNEEVDHQRALL